MTINPHSDAAVSSRSNALQTRTRWRLLITRFLVILLCAAGLSLLLYLDSMMGHHSEMPSAGENLSYGLLFVTGLLTGFHCVGMCGALVVSYTVKTAQQKKISYATHFFYGLGKTLSYTTIGGLFGALGAIITFTPLMRGLAGIGAGIFLFLFGLSLLNIFKPLNRFRIKTPGALMRWVGKAYKKNSHPFVIGLLNGLMIICGPLQALYIMAAGTGSPIEGAKLLFAFGLGTLPVMLGFGLLTSVLSANVAPKIIKASGVIVVALGVIMFNRGLIMTGSGYDFHTLIGRLEMLAHRPSEETPPVGYQELRMEVNHQGFVPNQFILRKGVPVKWIINATEVTYCNHRISVPALGLEFDVHSGENIIEFTPQQVGIISWSCWMGMIPGTFLVHEEITQPPPSQPPLPLHEDHHASEKSHETHLDWMKKLHHTLTHWFTELTQH